MTDDERKAAHQRWVRNRDPVDGAIQCYGCKYHAKLRTALGLDWGVCANSKSPYDGLLKFEHQGCSEHVASE